MMNMSLKLYSEASGISEDKLRHLIREYGFPAIRVGTGYIVNDVEADRWFQAHQGEVMRGRRRK